MVVGRTFAGVERAEASEQGTGETEISCDPAQITSNDHVCGATIEFGKSLILVRDEGVRRSKLRRDDGV